jgi:hypothetical protein
MVNPTAAVALADDMVSQLRQHSRCPPMIITDVEHSRELVRRRMAEGWSLGVVRDEDHEEDEDDDDDVDLLSVGE